MKNYKKEKVLVFVFFSILTLPSFIYPFVKEKMDQTNYENRSLSTIDIVKNSNLALFPENFEIYYNDHLPFKNELQTLRAAVKYKLFKSPTSEKVIIGKKDWFFYNSGVDGITNEVGDFRKTTRFTDDEYKLVKNNLITVKEKLKKERMNFYLLIPSNKSSVYPEYMPNIYKRDEATNQNKTEALIDKIQDDINVIYPKAALIEYKKIANTYYQYDTHWNGFGGIICTLELAKNIEHDDFDINNLNITKVTNTVGDLALMNQTLKFVNNEEPTVNGYYDDLNPNCTTSEDVIECYEPNAKYNKTLMLIGDSFRTAMISSLSKTYKHVVIVYVPMFNYSYIKNYKPNDVVYEVVERNLYQLFTIQDYFRD